MSLKKSIMLSTALRPVGMLISLVYTPLLLSYLGQEEYGIWVTILSVINWINYFDIGIGNGYRNRLTEALAQDDEEATASLTRTAYLLLTGIVAAVFVIGCALIFLLDVNSFFKTDIAIRSVLLVSFFFVCVNFVAALCKPQLFALQRAELVSLMSVCVSGLTLLFVAGLDAFMPRSMMLVAICVGMAGLITNIAFSIVSWRAKEELRPTFGLIDRSSIRSICGLGVQFFLIQIAALVLYTTDNLIVMGCVGAAAVTAYSTTYSAFNAVSSLVTAALTPMWSKVTEAATNGDFGWVSRVLRKCLLATLPLDLGFVLLAVFFKPIARIWLGTELEYTAGLIPCMTIYFVLFLLGQVLSYVANGLGRVKVQLACGVGGAVVNIPLSIFLCVNCSLGSPGVLLATISTMVASNAATYVDLVRYLRGKAGSSNK